MAKRKKSQAGNLVVYVIVISVLVGVALAGYYKIMKRQQVSESDQTPKTEAEKLIAKDLEAGYPDTPAEVMKLWGRYNQCIYNSGLTDEQYGLLLKQLRMMYSSDLLSQNKEEDQSIKLKAEIDEFQGNKSKIVSYSTDTGKSVQYKTLNNRECAYLKLSYFISQKNGYSQVYEDFILVKEDGAWKILGFKMDNESGETSVPDNKG